MNQCQRRLQYLRLNVIDIYFIGSLYKIYRKFFYKGYFIKIY